MINHLTSDMSTVVGHGHCYARNDEFCITLTVGRVTRTTDIVNYTVSQKKNIPDIFSYNSRKH